MPILIMILLIVLLVSAIIYVSIKVIQFLINQANKKSIHNSELDKTKIKDL